MINTVGAASLRATLNCEAFAAAHAHDAHFDRSSFVGLAWRPADEACCCEAYSTGRMNLPGSRTERSLQASFMRMLPELLRFSSGARLLAHIPETVQAAHRTQCAVALPSAVALPAVAEAEADPTADPTADDIDDGALAALGL